MEVSVVLCSYNGEKFIASQLDSILDQTYPLKEVLVYDDCSTDGTIDILKKYEKGASLIKVFRNERNIGFNQNFQKALKAASGEVIAISDQDDIWVNTKIERMIAEWKPDVPLIYCKSVQFTNELPVLKRIDPDSISFDGTEGRKLSYFNSVSGHATMIRLDLLQKVLPFADGIMYDWWMAVVAAYNGGVQFIPEILVYHRVHQDNITVTTEKISKKEKIRKHNQQATLHNKIFAKTPNIPAAHQRFFNQFATLLEDSHHGKLHRRLLSFLMRNRKLIFYYKSSFNLLSYFKHSYRIAKY